MKYIYRMLIWFLCSFRRKKGTKYIFVCSPFHIKFSLPVPVPEISLAIFPTFLFHQWLISIANSTALKNLNALFFLIQKSMQLFSEVPIYSPNCQLVIGIRFLITSRPDRMNKLNPLIFYKYNRKGEGGHPHYFVSVVVSRLY